MVCNDHPALFRPTGNVLELVMVLVLGPRRDLGWWAWPLGPGLEFQMGLGWVLGWVATMGLGTGKQMATGLEPQMGLGWVPASAAS